MSKSLLLTFSVDHMRENDAKLRELLTIQQSQIQIFDIVKHKSN